MHIDKFLNCFGNSLNCLSSNNIFAILLLLNKSAVNGLFVSQMQEVKFRTAVDIA